MPWTRSLPETPGLYWIWQPAGELPCNGEVKSAEVERHADGGLEGWIHQRDFTNELEPEHWREAWWYGPIEPPAPPA